MCAHNANEQAVHRLTYWGSDPWSMIIACAQNMIQMSCCDDNPCRQWFFLCHISNLRAEAFEFVAYCVLHLGLVLKTIRICLGWALPHGGADVHHVHVLTASFQFQYAEQFNCLSHLSRASHSEKAIPPQIPAIIMWYCHVVCGVEAKFQKVQNNSFQAFFALLWGELCPVCRFRVQQYEAFHCRDQRAIKFWFWVWLTVKKWKPPPE